MARASAINLGPESSEFTLFGGIYFMAVTGLRSPNLFFRLVKMMMHRHTQVPLQRPAPVPDTSSNILWLAWLVCVNHGDALVLSTGVADLYGQELHAS